MLFFIDVEEVSKSHDYLFVATQLWSKYNEKCATAIGFGDPN